MQRVKRTASQALISAVYGLGDIVAGLILWLYLPPNAGWTALIYPPLIGARGAITGSILGRLTTALNIGTVEPNLKGENEKLWEILSTGISASLLTSFIVLIPFSFIGLNAMLTVLLPISLITVSGVSLILIPTNIIVSFTSFRRGLDPDIVVYPLVSTIADIAVTLLYIGSIRLVGTPINTMLSLLVIAISILVVAKWFSKDYIGTLLEIMISSLLVILIESTAGMFLEKAVKISDTSLLLIYPAMLTELGDSSSIMGSILTTKLFLGTLRRKALITDLLPELAGIFIAYLGFFFILGGLMLALGGNPWVSVLTFLIAFPIMLILTIAIVMLTSRRFDPDNFTIPLATSIADLVTTAIASFVLSLL